MEYWNVPARERQDNHQTDRSEFSFPGSAWECPVREAPPRCAGGAGNTVRYQAEPGNEKKSPDRSVGSD